VPTITANVPLLDGVFEISIDGQAITAVHPSTQTTNLYVGPALFDVQVNGYGGRTCRLAGPEAQDALVWIARLMHELGVGWWMPTITTSTPEVLETAFTCCGRALDEDPVLAASIPGLHLEGPYISPVEGPRGAHQLECVRPPDWDEFCRLQDASGGRIRLVTVAPEVDGAIDFIKRCVGTGVVVGMGHTDLDREALLRAVDAGATLSTHLGNGAHDQLQRHNNYLWYQLENRQTFASFIADGHHLPAATFKAMLRAKTLERAVLTSDAVKFAGMPAGAYGDDGDFAVDLLVNGRVQLAGTPYLAGAGLPLVRGVENAVRFAGVPLAAAWRLAAHNPARLLGLEDRGALIAGARADFVVCDWDADACELYVRETVVAGEVVYAA